jgi:hypothetical protein
VPRSCRCTSTTVLFDCSSSEYQHGPFLAGMCRVVFSAKLAFCIVLLNVLGMQHMRQTMIDDIPPVLCLAKRFIENLTKRELRDASLFLSCVFLCFFYQMCYMINEELGMIVTSSGVQII